MEEYLDEIEGWMEQVCDDELSVEDYDFLDRLVHGGSKNNGNNGVANVGAYLAIYEEDGELQVDEELVQTLDEQQAEEHYGRKRFSNIVHDAQTSKREDNTLHDKGVDGHQVIREWINDFRDSADWRNVPDPQIFNNTNPYQKSKSPNGGDNTMVNLAAADDRLQSKFDDLEETLAEDDYTEAREHVYAIAEDLGVNEEELREAEENYDDLREATYAMLGVAADRVDDLAEEYEGNRAEYEDLVNSLESVRATAGDISLSEEHRRHVEQDEEFVERYLDGDEDEEE
ncbi:MAG: hypothetical protein ABEJ99_05750 [Candidatus Nanohaloarchaea archaeon]